jgi:glycosyltransferase involved in cell wall biosynthesis
VTKARGERRVVNYVDISAAVHGRAGLGRYAGLLARHLIAREPEEFALFFNGMTSTRLPEGLSGVPRRSVPAGYKPWRMAVLLGQLAHVGFDGLIPGADLYHATEHLLMPLRHTPCILTVHDLVFRLFPQHHRLLNYAFLNLAVPMFLRRADHLIAVSHATKQDLVRLYGTNPNRITVIHEAADARFRPRPPEEMRQVKRKYGLPDRYILSLGTLEPRKNYQRLVEAYGLLAHWYDTDHGRMDAQKPRLVIAGGRGWLYQPFLRWLQDAGIREDVVLLGHVSDEDLPALYSAATLFVFASLYEGFGLPPLEAMACGAPVVCSGVSSLPEVGGKAVRYFDPTDPDDMAQVMQEVLTDGTLQAKMKEDGLKRASAFSWERTAEETLAVYQAARDSNRLA